MIKGIIFDSDGVLVETDEYHYLAWKTIAEQEHIDFDRTINNQLRGISRAESLEIILKRASKTYTEDEKLALSNRKNEIYLNYIRNLSSDVLNPEVVSTLKKLKAAGIKVAVGSSSVSTELVLEKLNIKDLFDVVVTGKDVMRSKPEADIFLLAAAKMGLDPKNILIVEDGVSGILAGVKGGFVTCGIKEAANYYQTQHAITTFADVLAVVREINKSVD